MGVNMHATLKKCILILTSIVMVVTASDHSVISSNLPMLYRVDQPTSNVVVFRGYDYKLAQQTGLLGSLGLNPASSLNKSPANNKGYSTTTAAPKTTTRPYRPPTYPPTPTTPAPRPYPTHPPTYPTHRPVIPQYPTRPTTYPQYPPVEANYDWEYNVKEHYNDFGHKESRHGYAATGKYYVALPDGRLQVVTYVADEFGYKPTVEFEGQAAYPEDNPYN